MKHLLPFFLLLTAPVFSQTHWESVVIAGNTWKYFPAVNEPPANWYQATFDDNSWQSASGGFGYGDGDDATIIGASNSVYLRKKFNISDTSVIEKLLLDVDYDDAFVAYLNGSEVGRSFNITANPAQYNSALTIDHEAQLYQQNLPQRILIDKIRLKPGENILAVQVLNNGISSSDMSALVFLSAEIDGNEIIYQNTPDWFIAPADAENSNLPLIFIDTQGQVIQDEPKITARMSILNNPGGNNIHDTNFEFDGYIGIETRGSSSQMFEKKNYSVETRTDTGTNLNVSLLGMPEENDWVLHGPYSDKSLMRNVLAYHLGNLTGRWSPRTRFCELYINNDYRGVYVLIEKIKKDKNRVDIADLNPIEITGDDLTGGYILKVDRAEEGAWISPYQAGGFNLILNYADPEYSELANAQRVYIRDYVTYFEDALYGENFTDPLLGYRPLVNLTSFADYYLINELSRNVDAYRLSAFFYKDKNSKDGRLVMGPLWDYNLGFGNSDYYAAAQTEGWVADGISPTDGFQIPFWWDRFRQDPYFEGTLKARWNELRSNPFSDENIAGFIDSCANLLSQAQQRNFQRFNILGSYVWPNAYVGGTYTNEINYLKNWISDRLAWMDYQIDQIEYSQNPEFIITGDIQAIAYPNPFTEKVVLQLNLTERANIEVIVRNILGETVFMKSDICQQGMNEFTFRAESFQNGSGVYFYEVYADGKPVISGKLIKK